MLNIRDIFQIQYLRLKLFKVKLNLSGFADVLPLPPRSALKCDIWRKYYKKKSWHLLAKCSHETVSKTKRVVADGGVNVVEKAGTCKSLSLFLSSDTEPKNSYYETSWLVSSIPLPGWFGALFLEKDLTTLQNGKIRADRKCAGGRGRIQLLQMKGELFQLGFPSNRCEAGQLSTSSTDLHSDIYCVSM